MTQAGDVLASDGFRADADDFAALFAETFFRCSAMAVRRHDPNHMVLGCRWAGPQPANIMAAEARWVDVISINNYQDMFYERIEEHPNPLDLPIVIGEFCWNDDSHMTIEMPFEDPVGLTCSERMVRRAARRCGGCSATRTSWVSPGIVGSATIPCARRGAVDSSTSATRSTPGTSRASRRSSPTPSTNPPCRRDGRDAAGSARRRANRRRPAEGVDPERQGRALPGQARLRHHGA